MASNIRMIDFVPTSIFKVRDILKDIEKGSSSGVVDAAEAVRQSAYDSMRQMPDGVHAPPGSPPYSHTGKLKDSLKVRRSSDGAEVYSEYSPGMYYAHFQEYGTSKMAARPFLVPALERELNSIEYNVNESIAENLKPFGIA